MPTSAGRGVLVVEDDLGRPSISYADARRLVSERREAAARARELAERHDQELEEQRLASLHVGVPAVPGELPSTALLMSARDERPRRQSMVEHALSNDGGFVFHPLGPEGDEQ